MAPAVVGRGARRAGGFDIVVLGAAGATVAARLEATLATEGAGGHPIGGLGARPEPAGGGTDSGAAATVGGAAGSADGDGAEGVGAGEWSEAATPSPGEADDAEGAARRA